MSRYRKFLTALVGAGVAFLGRRWGIDSDAYLDIVLVLTAAGVYAVPNDPA